MKHESVAATFMLATLLILVLAAAMDDYKDAKAEEQLYCSMVQQHLATGGQFGWPDYKGVYGEVCEVEK